MKRIANFFAPSVKKRRVDDKCLMHLRIMINNNDVQHLIRESHFGAALLGYLVLDYLPVFNSFSDSYSIFFIKETPIYSCDTRCGAGRCVQNIKFFIRRMFFFFFFLLAPGAAGDLY